MINQAHIKRLTGHISELFEAGYFEPLEVDIISQKYLDEGHSVDVRVLSRRYKKPMKHIKREIEKTDRKLYNALKKYL